MHWEVEVCPRNPDRETQRIADEMVQHGLPRPATLHAARVYLLGGNLSPADIQCIARQLLTDDTVETAACRSPDLTGAAEHALGAAPQDRCTILTILPKPGVMDPVAESVQNAVGDLELPPPRVRTGRRYRLESDQEPAALLRFAQNHLANEAIEQVLLGPLPASAWASTGSPTAFQLVRVPLRAMSDDALLRLSKEGQLHLSLAEMQTIRSHFLGLGRDPTDAELETLAQTWSEHCSHKTLKGKIEFDGPAGIVFYDNLLKATIFGATQEIRRQLGADDWCVSVFSDNAGIIRFDNKYHVCFKVETHNHPSAIEPYGGANTGLGGVIRDVLGTGLGGEPVCNTNVFCFAPPDFPETQLPPGVLHPKRVMRGVVAGVRDYGNRMGIPTVNGAICFDPRYLANPLVYCGTVGLIPMGMEHKHVLAGDLIVAVGGRTGRDGIHGATFSSTELTQESDQVSGGAVQIGNAITEKQVLDVLLPARDRRLYRAITDCGAGGFSSAVGEMGAELGAEVHLDRAPLKYEGLTATEIWISEAQERMVLAVPPERWAELQELCAGEGVEAVALGEFQSTGRLRLYYHGEQLADLDMHFLHEGRPPVVRKAEYKAPAVSCLRSAPTTDGADLTADLLQILSALNVCSKEWVIRQYDHEVRGGSVIKPLVGRWNDGPSDAAVVAPVLGSHRGIALGCGINPRLGELDPYGMAASAIDEAVRNVVAVGADPSRVALLDNFCWGNTDRPETLGTLVRAAEACRDLALALGTPFISGKDSLNNEFKSGAVHLRIPPTLLISAIGIVADVRRCVTMDLKQPGNLLYLVGSTHEELGGSHWHLIRGVDGGQVPGVDGLVARRRFRCLHEAIQQGLVASCHDLSEGGFAAALAEMCLAGGLGAVVKIPPTELSAAAWLFSESNTRFLVEVPAAQRPQFEAVFKESDSEHAPACLGTVTDADQLSISSAAARPVIAATVSQLRDAWQQPLRW